MAQVKPKCGFKKCVYLIGRILLYNIVMALAIHQHESAIGMHVSLPSWTFLLPAPPHPSMMSQSTGFGFPASYIKLSLAVYFTYGDAYISVLVPESHPTFSFSQRAPKSVLQVFISFVVLHIGSFWYYDSDYYTKTFGTFKMHHIRTSALISLYSFWRK